jgi:hypothetical protein
MKNPKSSEPSQASIASNASRAAQLVVKAQLTTVATGERFIAEALPVHKGINNREWQSGTAEK